MESSMLPPSVPLRRSSTTVSRSTTSQSRRSSMSSSSHRMSTDPFLPPTPGSEARPYSSASHPNTYLPVSEAQSFARSSTHAGLRRHASTASGRRSRAASSVWGSQDHQVICAISEARGVSPSVGLAFINITTNEAVLSQICDTQFYVKTVHKIQIYDPSTVLMVNTSFPPNPKSNLLAILEEELQDAKIEALDRKYWSEAAGFEFLSSLAFREDLDAIKVAVQGNFYATCSFAAAIKYLDLACHLIVMSHSLRIRYQPSEDSMMIDISTIHSLELIQNLQNAKSKHCLFGVLNSTLTPMGSRMMRSNILQPSTQIEHTLNPRHDALDELTIKEDMFFEIRKALKSFSDVEKLLTRVRAHSLVIIPDRASIQESEQAINNILMIKAFVLAVAPLHEALGSASSDLLQRISDICRAEAIQPIVDLITGTINEDVTYVDAPVDMRHQRTYAVKSGVHGMLDVARQTYKEGVEDVHQYMEDVNREYELSAELRYDQNRKYWFRLKDCDLEGRTLPDVLINRVRKGAYVECQTLVLVQFNNRITDSHNEVVMLSDRVIQELLDAIRGHIATLFRVCESVALLDMLSAFGHSATMRDYVRPEFGDVLALKAARHPILDTMISQKLVPNDVYAAEQHRFQIITGCNMSGKSTYIRMIALLQVMAQIGCFIPAEFAAFPVIHQLFVRMSTDDSIEANMSTFSIEMREMAFILRNINEKSLTIVDELGRGTSTRDGLAIALAISEALIQSNSLVWFVTHFTQLVKVLGSRPGVLNLHLSADLSKGSVDEAPKMTMLYKINSGPVQEENYGLNLAKVVGFPERFMKVATNVSNALKDEIEQKRQISKSRKLVERRRLVLNLHEQLKQLKGSPMDDAALGSYLQALQHEFVTRMDQIISAENRTGVDEGNMDSGNRVCHGSEHGNEIGNPVVIEELAESDAEVE